MEALAVAQVSTCAVLGFLVLWRGDILDCVALAWEGNTKSAQVETCATSNAVKIVQIAGRRLQWVVLAGVAGCLVLAASCSGPGPSIEQGRSLYRENGCGSCHGASGRGDGPLAASLIIPPANLHEPAHFKRGASEVEIAKTLAEGIHDMQGSTPQLHQDHHDLAMPKFDHLSEVERRSIALYVISMQKSDN